MRMTSLDVHKIRIQACDGIPAFASSSPQPTLLLRSRIEYLFSFETNRSDLLFSPTSYCYDRNLTISTIHQSFIHLYPRRTLVLPLCEEVDVVRFLLFDDDLAGGTTALLMVAAVSVVAVFSSSSGEVDLLVAVSSGI